MAMMLPSLMLCAQNEGADKGKQFFPYWYVQVQGGAQELFTSGELSDLVTPNYGFSIGRNFHPAFGARLNFTGWESKVKYNSNFEKFNYINVNLDLLCNVSSFFSKKKNRPLNFYLLAGIGANYSWGKDWTPSNLDEVWGHNFRLGAIAEYKIFKPLSLTIEADFDNMGDKFDGHVNNSSDWMGSLKLGLAYNFAYSKKPYNYVKPVQEMKPLTLYEQMQLGVMGRLNDWKKRLKGESDEEYKLRTEADSINSLRLQYEREISTEMAGNKINESQYAFGKYNTRKELLTVDFNSMPSIALNVPRSDVGFFNTADDITFQNTVYGLNKNDEFEVIYTEVLNGKNSKKYIYNGMRGKNFDPDATDDYLPLTVAQQTIMNDIRLEQIKTDAVKKAMENNIISGNTTISVETEAIQTKDVTGKNVIDYRVSYKYTVKDEFSTYDDFAPGKYDAEKANASAAMMEIIKTSFETDFAPFVKAGKACKLSFTGTADAMPIHGVIAYKGEYGDIDKQEVTLNGNKTNLTVTKKTGIRNNESLSLVRAVSLKNYIYKNMNSLKQMKTENEYILEVSPEVGGNHRRVRVDFLFHDAF